MTNQRFVYGAAKIANLTENVAYQIVSQLYEHNVTQIDTAPSYGDSETLIGKINQDFPNLKINSKVGVELNNEFTSSQIKGSVYQSLDRLQITSLDTLFIHSVPVYYLSLEVFEALVELKKEKVVKKLAILAMETIY